jgi:hypothetical protein
MMCIYIYIYKFAAATLSLLLVLIHEVEFLIECARFPPLPIYDNGKNNNSKTPNGYTLGNEKKKSFQSITKKSQESSC